jgi:hypothetical protein
MNITLEQQIVELYDVGKWTLRRIASHFGTNHHSIKRVLIKNGIPIDGAARIRRPMSQATRNKISIAHKGLIPWSKGKKMSLAFRQEQMIIKLKTDIDFTKYTDFDRLIFLTKVTTRHIQAVRSQSINRWVFVDKFYNDPSFVKLYSLWINSGKKQMALPINRPHSSAEQGRNLLP